MHSLQSTVFQTKTHDMRIFICSGCGWVTMQVFISMQHVVMEEFKVLCFR